MKNYVRCVISKVYKLIRQTPIFLRLFTGFVIVIIITGIFMTNYIYKITEKQFYTTGINYVYENLENNVQRTYNKIREYENSVEKIIYNETLMASIINNSVSEEKIQEYIFDWKSSIKSEAIFIVTEDNCYGEKSGVNFVDIDKFRSSQLYQKSMIENNIQWFNTIKENDVYYANEKKNSYIGNYITMTSPIRINGETQGLLVMLIDVARLSGLASVNKLYNQDLFLTDENGIITYLSSDYVYRNYDKDIFSNCIKSEDKLYESEVDNEDLILVPQKLGRGDWYVVSVVVKDELLKSSYEVQKFILIISLTGIVISLIICIVVTLSIYYPLNRLKQAMSKYAQKDFYMDFTDVGKDQIAQVSNIFKSMVERIRTLAKEQVNSQKEIGKARLKQKESYLSALQMQINPHFLYNMLDLIRWNIVSLENGNGRISRMISGYSSLLRYSIKLGDTYAKLEEEIEHAHKYIKILELLYDKQIKFEVVCNDDSIKKCLVTKLLLQPIIENTITHGKIHLTEEPFIKIEVFKENEEIMVSITNNGKSITEEKMNELNNLFEKNDDNYVRIGLNNVNKRIKLLFGENYGLKVLVYNGMTCIRMNIPAIYYTEEK